MKSIIHFWVMLTALLVTHFPGPALSATDCSQATVSPGECQALIDLDQYVGGELEAKGWFVDNDPCGWDINHIKCTGSNITQLNLLYQNSPLTGVGSFPDSIGNLKNLTHLTLSGNYFQELPTSISNLTNLAHLALSGTPQFKSFSGTLPSISHFTNLRYLAIANTEFSGAFPDVANLTKLENLFINKGNFSGPFPNICGLQNLKGIRLASNHFYGEVNACITSLPLTDIQFSNNCFNPPSQRVIDYVQTITNDTSWVDKQTPNNCPIPVPAPSGNTDCDEVENTTGLPKAECLVLLDINQSVEGELQKNHNWLKDNDPCSWNKVQIKCNSNQTSITGINLSNLSLTASNIFPDSISDLSQLTHLDLSGNQFQQLPANIAQMTSLKHIGFSGSNTTKSFTGKLPDIGNLINLTFIGIANTGFTSGNFPDITKLTQLQHFYINRNAFTGGFPNVCGMTQLIGMRLQANQFAGDIDACVTKLADLTEIRLKENCFNPPAQTIKDYFSANSTIANDIALVETQTAVNCPTTPPPTCGYILSSPGKSHGSGELTGDFSVTASAPQCSWQATTSDSWITLTSGQNQSNQGIIQYELSSNPTSSSRTGIITIASGVEYTITQEPANTMPCLDIPKEECQALMDINQYVKDELKIAHGWFKDKYPCSWDTTQLTCNQSGHVVTLNIGKKSLTGTGVFPASIGNLKALTHLTLSGNHFETLPASISELTNLAHLAISGDKTTKSFSGVLPDLGKLTNLRYIAAANTGFSGDFPDVSALLKVENIFVNGGNFTGDFPNLCGLTQLKGLRLNDNQFEGALKPCITQLTQLSEFMVSDNCFTPASQEIKNFFQANAISNDVALLESNPPAYCAQSPVCSFTAAQSNAALSADAQSAAFDITASATHCPWSASTTESWITLGTDQGTGSGTVTFSVAENSRTTERTGGIAINTQTQYTVTQSGKSIQPCVVTVSPATIPPIASVGGENTLMISVTPTTCSWEAISQDSWLRILGGQTGTNSGELRYQVDPNTNSASRTSQLRIGDLEVPITQNGEPPCSYLLGQNPNIHSAEAESGSLTVNTSRDTCGWNLAMDSLPGWLNFTSPITGQGSTVLHYAVSANADTEMRQVALTVGGQRATIKQQGKSNNLPPVAKFTASPRFGDELPLLVTLDASASRDDDGVIQRYEWEATSSGETFTATGRQAAMSLDPTGVYTITLTVTDDSQAQDTVSHTVVAGEFLQVTTTQNTYYLHDTLSITVSENQPPYRAGPVDIYLVASVSGEDAIVITEDAHLIPLEVTGNPFEQILTDEQIFHTKPFATEVSPTDLEFTLADLPITADTATGVYTLYAIYVESGKNPFAEGLEEVQRSNLAKHLFEIKDFEAIAAEQAVTDYLTAEFGAAHVSVHRRGDETSLTVTFEDGSVHYGQLDTSRIKPDAITGGVVSFTEIADQDGDGTPDYVVKYEDGRTQTLLYSKEPPPPAQPKSGIANLDLRFTSLNSVFPGSEQVSNSVFLTLQAPLMAYLEGSGSLVINGEDTGKSFAQVTNGSALGIKTRAPEAGGTTTVTLVLGDDPEDPDYQKATWTMTAAVPDQPVIPEGVLSGNSAISTEVNESGAANACLPITAPPGTGGMEPQLSLCYSSQGTNGPVGMGWSLSGLSVITRCPATKAQDSFNDPVDFDEQDRFCLDGERLMVAGGDYGADQAWYFTEQQSFQKVVSHGHAGTGPAYFTVQTKSGLTLYYGENGVTRTADEPGGGGRIEAQGREDVLFWAVDRIEDSKGNYLRFHYREDVDNGAYYLQRVDYTGNQNTSLQPYAYVNFLYEARNDKPVKYIAGSRLQTTERLRKIETKYGPEVYRSYTLTYEESGLARQSFLTSVQECGEKGSDGEPVCFQPTRFAWTGDASLAESEATWAFEPGWGEEQRTWAADFDGNGLTDIASAKGDKVYMKLSTGSGFRSETWVVENLWGTANFTWIGDFDGNGLPDIASASNEKIYVKLSTGTGFESKTWIVEKTWGGDVYTWVADFDGNGMADIASAAYGNVYMKLATGSGFRSETWTVENRWYHPWLWVGDFDGNGLPDIATAAGENMFMKLSTGSGFISETWKVANTWDKWDSQYTWNGDFNGDGLADVGSLAPDSTKIHMKLSTGKGFRSEDWPTENLWGTAEFTWAGDFDGNGLTDIITMEGNNAYLKASTGGGFSQGVWAGQDKTWEKSAYRKFGDFDGNGTIDIASIKTKSVLIRFISNFIYEENYLLNNWSVVPRYDQVTYNCNLNNGIKKVYLLPTSGFLDELGISCGEFADRIVENVNNNWVSSLECPDNLLIDGFDYHRVTSLNQYLVQRVEIHCSSSDGKKTYSSEHWHHPSDNHRVECPKGQFVTGLQPYNNKVSYKSNIENIGVKCSSISLSEKNNPKRLATITTGHGVKTTFTYTPLTDPTVYTKGGIPQEQQRPDEIDFIAPVQVVSALTTDNGVGGQHTVRYRYGGGTLHTKGRGFRGFARAEIRDETNQTCVATEYDRRYEYLGTKVKSTRQYLGDCGSGQLISETVNQPELNLLLGDSGIRFSWIKSTTTKAFEPNCDGDCPPVKITTASNTYDDYGNPTNIRVEHRDGSGKLVLSEETESTYLPPDLDKWYLGRLSQATVTKAKAGQGELSRTSRFEYDPQSGMLVAEILEPGHALCREKHYTHDAYGNVLTSTTQACGNAAQARVLTSEYDDQGRFALTIRNALNHRETKTYFQASGNVKTLTGPNQLTTQWQYDGFGRPLRETRADGTWTRTAYRLCKADDHCPARAVHYVVSQSAGSSPEYTYFDGLDREIRKATQGFDGTRIYTDQVYNERGLVIQQSQPYFAGSDPVWSEIAYDASNRPIREASPDRTIPGGMAITTTTYEADGLTTKVVDPAGRATRAFTDILGQLVKSEDALGNPVTYIYDAYGNLIEMRDVAGNVTMMVYDELGNKIQLSDPDSGTTRYEYNALGELIAQTDANGQRITLRYDKLGRLVERQAPEGGTTWHYDTAPGKGIGKLFFAQGPDGYIQYQLYDDFGRPRDSAYYLDNGEMYTSTVHYDRLGRVDTITYPTGFAVRHGYNAFGYLQRVEQADDSNQVFWEAQRRNARGQLEAFQLGNGLTTEKTYDTLTGRIQTIETAAGATQNLEYTFDVQGNLKSRSKHGLTETFTHDKLNRLTSSAVGGSALRVGYDALGNITHKTGVGVYSYHANKPHAVRQAGDTTYQYDQNGNRILAENPQSRQEITYTSFNKPSMIRQNSTTLRFSHGPDQARYRQIATQNGQTSEKRYFGKLFEHEITGGAEQYLHHIFADGEAVAIHTRDRSNTQSTQYLHRDHLGSLDTITDERGEIVQELSFDAWGKRRSSQWRQLTDAELRAEVDKLVSDRGFTGHEHLDEVELIHMNGRIYDPVIGRFLNPDPIIQQPGNLQNLNRYSYVLNNPLSLVDPSGFIFGIGRAIKKTFKKAEDWISDHKREIIGVVSVAVNFILPGAGLALGNALGIGALGGAILSGAGMGFGMAFSDSLMRGGNLSDAVKFGLRGALVGGITGGLDNGAGSSIISNTLGIKNNIVKLIAHGLIQGVKNEISGGKFKDGFLSGIFSGIKAQNPFSMLGCGGSVGISITGGASGKSNCSIGSEIEIFKSVLNAAKKGWASPNSMLGLAYGGVGHVLGWVMDTKPKISLGNNAIQFINNPLMSSAMTFGNVVVYNGGAKYSPDSLTFVSGSSRTLGYEEMQHTFQAEILGPLYFPGHIASGISGLIFDKSWHGKSAFLEAPVHTKNPSSF